MQHSELVAIIERELKPQLAIISMRLSYLEHQAELADRELARLLSLWREEVKLCVN